MVGAYAATHTIKGKTMYYYHLLIQDKDGSSDDSTTGQLISEILISVGDIVTVYTTAVSGLRQAVVGTVLEVLSEELY